jgi:three-Cys-motif partner protein
MEHAFGGEWTEAKLEIVSRYANSFQTALKHQPFETWYIDPFAGSGERTETRVTGGLLEGSPLEEKRVTFEGSARRALNIRPAFHHYRFADTKPAHVEALRKIATEYPDRDIGVWPGDGNQAIQEIVTAAPWTSPRNGWRQRGIVFLDPYGMNVSWETLRRIADTKRLDVWFLFAAKAVRQQLGPSLDRVDEGKAAALDRFFGQTDWRQEFFRPPEDNTDLFGFQTAKAQTSVNLQAIGAYARRRFGHAFCWVSEPKSLRVRNVPDFFQLYCMTNNEKAAELIAKLHRGVVKAHEQASRHRSGL